MLVPTRVKPISMECVENSPWLPPATVALLEEAIQVVEDFPKPGITFRNVLPVLARHDLLARLVDALRGPYLGMDRSRLKVVGIESRGFIFASFMALGLSAGFVPARKADLQPDGTWRCKLPGELDYAAYSLEYGSAALAMQRGMIEPGDRVIVVDDLLATGGTAEAAASLARRQGGEVISHDFIIELRELGGRKRLLPAAIANSPTAGFHALLTY